MNAGLVEEIANAVLYEGYVLYPYRASSVKNRQRWNFGVIYPEAYSSKQEGADSCWMRTECLAHCSTGLLNVKVRFLQLTMRTVELAPDFRSVARLEVDDRVLHPWQEAVEREVCVGAGSLAGLALKPLRQRFVCDATRIVEPVHDRAGRVPGQVVRRANCVEGAVEVDAQAAGEDLYRIGVTIRNLLPFENAAHSTRDEALMHSLVSTHTILTLEGGEFISSLDPPEELAGECAKCRNTGTWPVLTGDERLRNTMLSSPVILYDYPKIAPESPGSLFDGTEIDEILTLRILTLTDDEKREMRDADPRTRQILERTEALLPEQLMKLHGEMR